MAQLQSGKWDFKQFENSKFHSVFSLCVISEIKILTDVKEQVNADILLRCAIWQSCCRFLKDVISFDQT